MNLSAYHPYIQFKHLSTFCSSIVPYTYIYSIGICRYNLQYTTEHEQEQWFLLQHLLLGYGKKNMKSKVELEKVLLMNLLCVCIVHVLYLFVLWNAHARIIHVHNCHLLTKSLVLHVKLYGTCSHPINYFPYDFCDMTR